MKGGLNNLSELQLSNELNLIATRIKSNKSLIGYSLIEIGKDLNEAKMKDKEHGEWLHFLKEVGIQERQAQRMMKVAKELDTNTTTWSELPFRTLYEIATLPQEEREKEHVTSKGETKTVDEMTIRELEEVRKKLKEKETEANQYLDWYDDATELKSQAEQQAEIERKERERLEEELENQEPERVEVTKEVYPQDYESNKRMLDYVNKENDRLQEELDSFKMKDSSDFDEEKAEKELQKLQWEAERSVYRFINKVDDFMEEISIFGYMEGEIATSSNKTKDRLSESVNVLKNFTRKMETSLNGRIEI